MPTSCEIASEVTKELVGCLRYGMEKIDHCVAQLDEKQVWWRPHEDMNAIGNLLLHLSGNLGQWIVAGVGDTTDDRNRASEFSERQCIRKAVLLEQLHATVAKSCDLLERTTADDFTAIRTIQGWEVSKVHAMLHSTTHFQGHVQEIIGLTRQQLGTNYRFHWTPATPEEGAA